MSATFGKFRSSLMAALSKIGRVNGHAAPAGGSNTDALMHEYLVSTDAEAFFSRRRDDAKTAMLEAADVAALNKAVKDVKDTNTGGEVTLMQGTHYVLTCKIVKPATRLDAAKLRNELKLKSKMTDAQIAKLFEDCTTKNEPAKQFRVIGL